MEMQYKITLDFCFSFAFLVDFSLGSLGIISWESLSIFLQGGLKVGAWRLGGSSSELGGVSSGLGGPEASEASLWGRSLGAPVLMKLVKAQARDWKSLACWGLKIP